MEQENFNINNNIYNNFNTYSAHGNNNSVDSLVDEITRVLTSLPASSSSSSSCSNHPESNNVRSRVKRKKVHDSTAPLPLDNCTQESHKFHAHAQMVNSFISALNDGDLERIKSLILLYRQVPNCQRERVWPLLLLGREAGAIGVDSASHPTNDEMSDSDSDSDGYEYDSDSNYATDTTIETTSTTTAASSTEKTKEEERTLHCTCNAIVSNNNNHALCNKIVQYYCLRNGESDQLMCQGIKAIAWVLVNGAGIRDESIALACLERILLEHNHNHHPSRQRQHINDFFQMFKAYLPDLYNHFEEEGLLNKNNNNNKRNIKRTFPNNNTSLNNNPMMNWCTSWLNFYFSRECKNSSSSSNSNNQSQGLLLLLWDFYLAMSPTAATTRIFDHWHPYICLALLEEHRERLEELESHEILAFLSSPNFLFFQKMSKINSNNDGKKKDPHEPSNTNSNSNSGNNLGSFMERLLERSFHLKEEMSTNFQFVK